LSAPCTPHLRQPPARPPNSRVRKNAQFNFIILKLRSATGQLPALVNFATRGEMCPPGVKSTPGVNLAPGINSVP
jgi:hypothetical protein